MTGSDNLKQQIEGIESEIEELQEMLFQVESLRGSGMRPGLFQALSVRMLKMDLRRRIRDLGWRRKMAHNCYLETREYEAWSIHTEREDRNTRTVL